MSVPVSTLDKSTRCPWNKFRGREGITLSRKNANHIVLGNRLITEIVSSLYQSSGDVIKHASYSAPAFERCTL